MKQSFGKRGSMISLTDKSGKSFIESLAESTKGVWRSPTQNAYVDAKQFSQFISSIDKDAWKNPAAVFSKLDNIHIKGRKKVHSFQKTFVRQVLQLYRYTFIYLIQSGIYSSAVPLSSNTTKSELRRFEAGEKIEEVIARAPLWLKRQYNMKDIRLSSSAVWRATNAWVASGSLPNSFRVLMKKNESEGDILTGVAKFTRAGLKRRGNSDISAEDRAFYLEYGTHNQPARPIFRLITRSEMFQDGYTKLKKMLREKMSTVNIDLYIKNENLERTLENRIDSLSGE